MNSREVVADERTEGIESRNVRWTWVLLNYALAGDILYRGGFLRQDFGQFADIFFIWAGALVFFAVLDVATGGLTLAAFRLTAVPTMILAFVIAGGTLVVALHWSAWGVTAGVFVLSVVALLAFAVVRRRRRLRR